MDSPNSSRDSPALDEPGLLGEEQEEAIAEIDDQSLVKKALNQNLVLQAVRGKFSGLTQERIGSWYVSFDRHVDIHVKVAAIAVSGLIVLGNTIYFTIGLRNSFCLVSLGVFLLLTLDLLAKVFGPDLVENYSVIIRKRNKVLENVSDKLQKGRTLAVDYSHKAKAAYTFSLKVATKSWVKI